MPKRSLEGLRTRFLNSLAREVLGFRKGGKDLNIVDTSSPESCAIGRALTERLGRDLHRRVLPPQRVGSRFTEVTRQFLKRALLGLRHVRPGRWEVLSTDMPTGIMGFDQYAHLADLTRLMEEHSGLRAALGGDYLIKPDIVVARDSFSDSEINGKGEFVSDDVATYSPLRGRPSSYGRILHASVSCKWTIRSDRAQNVRTEALNLIRNRKGRAPHVVAVTFEPTPQRLASLARGTGDLDCVYHAALYELQGAVEDVGGADSRATLAELVDGRRLRDISDLPLDLAL